MSLRIMFLALLMMGFSSFTYADESQDKILKEFFKKIEGQWAGKISEKASEMREYTLENDTTLKMTGELVTDGAVVNLAETYTIKNGKFLSDKLMRL